MPEVANNPMPALALAGGLSPEVIADLAARLRPLGLFLLAQNPDGSAALHDGSASPFFLRYALPLLLARKSGPRSAGSAQVRELPEGLLVADVLLSKQRRQTGVSLLLCARAASFGMGEEVLAACGRLALDAEWLNRQARLVPPFGAEAFHAQVSLVAAATHDQVRIGGLEQQVDSLSTQLANSYEELSLIYQTSSGMKVDRRPREFFQQACQNLLDVLHAGAMGATLHSSSGEDAVLYGPLKLPPEILQRVGDELLPALAQRQGPLQINDLSKDRQWSWLAPYARQLLAVPLQRQEQVLGALFALDKGSGEFDSADAKLVNAIANEAAIYLENARLFGDVQALVMGLMHSLTSAVDAKDPYTCGHSERVALLSRHLAAESGLSSKEVEQVYMSALLHDVGKIGVPEAVLQKTGRLTAEEYEQMKRHPQIGARILQDVRQIRNLVPGVMHHHERYDGKGYPSGLAGKAIPMMGRIICLADCLDAMTSNRTYRRALPLEVALIDIRRCAGTQFDPGLADTLLRNSAEVIRDLLRDHHDKARKVLGAES